MKKNLIGRGRFFVGGMMLICVLILLAAFVLENSAEMGGMAKIVGMTLHLLVACALLFVLFRVAREPGLLDVKDAISDEFWRMNDAQEFTKNTVTVRVAYQQMIWHEKLFYQFFTFFSLVSAVYGAADIIGLIPLAIPIPGYDRRIVGFLSNYASGAIFLLIAFILATQRNLFTTKTILRQPTRTTPAGKVIHLPGTEIDLKQ